MVSNRLYYSRRAVKEQMAADRALTPQAEAWHRELAQDYFKKAQEFAVAQPA